ncbi:hypothetical protein M1K46_05960 [Fictibacillus sp. WQ 8-8]|uniref:hypothetical protein n=1 Tax=unclassified Fictibacillus TaxID=2644029 RepID=UPI0008E738A7|nr:MULTISPECIES: hypothetical protein [unclassified Fictibacillus]MCQ6265206.1 hypothetical protein [Fictibacillus sp. WQ 8-8]MED2971892.1 hypothetical protein [Fictibacillus sp. B-59209]SFD98993.1 hypothetical protein SAMN05428981_10310 [Bacillus sp. OV194]
MDEQIRYHFMYKERMAVTNEIIIQFMDFQGKRLVRATARDLNSSTNQKLKEDARKQWDRIKRAETMEQK